MLQVKRALIFRSIVSLALAIRHDHGKVDLQSCSSDDAFYGAVTSAINPVVSVTIFVFTHHSHALVTNTREFIGLFNSSCILCQTRQDIITILTQLKSSKICHVSSVMCVKLQLYNVNTLRPLYDDLGWNYVDMENPLQQ
jgi:hypothetical protein